MIKTEAAKERKRIRSKRTYALKIGQEPDEYVTATGEPKVKTEKPAKIKKFVAWDGEGVESLEFPGQQAYALFANSEGGVWIAPDGLSSKTLFDALLGYSAMRETVHVIYGGSYDANMWIKDLPEQNLRELVDPALAVPVAGGGRMNATDWQDYRIVYVQRKFFRIQQKDKDTPFKKVAGKWKPNYKRSITVWDAIGFFQSAFVPTVEKWLGRDYPDMDMIKAGKIARGTFTSEQLERDVLPYCRAELRGLVAIMDLMQGYLHAEGLKLKRWEGAGAVAAAMFLKEGMKQHVGKKNEMYSSQQQEYEVSSALRHAYAGGRIECIQRGYEQRPIFNYDLRSAYPAAMLQLPSFEAGFWRYHETDNDAIGSYALYHVRWHDVVGPIAPYFFRRENGGILFPPSGEGWYCKPEYDAAKAQAITQEVLGVWEWIPANSTKPFEFVREYYLKRAEYKRAGNGAEKVLKLGLNSLYGKTAQTVGSEYKNVQLGDTIVKIMTKGSSYYNMFWAAYMTSYVRAKIYTTCMQAPDDIVMTCTDGIYSKRALDLECSDALGCWELNETEGICTVLAGIYWSAHRGGKGETVGGSQWDAKYRGYKASELTLAMVIDAWKLAKKTRFPAEVKIKTHRFVALKAALRKKKGVDPLWRCWIDVTKTQRFVDSKRVMPSGYPNYHKALIPTLPAACIEYETGLQTISALYNPKWREEYSEETDLLMEGYLMDVDS